MKQCIHENFRRHNEHLGIGIGFNVACEQPEGNVGIFARKFGIFLVGKGLDGTGVDDFFPQDIVGQAVARKRAAARKMLNRKFSRQGFSRAGVGRDQDVLPIENASNGLFLKRTEFKRVLGKDGVLEHDRITMCAQ